MNHILIKRSKNKNRSIIHLTKSLRSINYFHSSEEMFSLVKKYSAQEEIVLNLNESNQDMILEILNDLDFNYELFN